VRLAAFQKAAAALPPAAVFQVSYACGLGIVRDLGARHGVPVLALDADPDAIGLRSRYAAGAVCPDPLADEEAFVTWLETLGRRLPRRAVVFPSHDEYIWPLSRHAARLEPWYVVPFSRWDAMQRVHDKRAQMQAAWRAGVDTPRTVFVNSGAELEAAASEIRFPAVLKPVESLAFKLRFHRHILDAATPADLQRIYDKVDDLGVLMLQERIPGGEHELWTVGSYLDAGSRPLAVFTGHKLRQYPHAGGSCLAGVSRWNQGLADAGLRLLQELRFHGVSQVEFKRDPRDGRFCLMEVNARHWKWHSLAAACGVNLSFAAYNDAVGRPYVTPRQIDGVKWIVVNKDVPLALLEVAKHERGPVEYVRSLRGTRVDGLHSLADPVPGLLNACTVAKQVATRAPRARADV
jgi:D-aspartate ligase